MPPPPYSQSLISLMVSVDVKHHVYLVGDGPATTAVRIALHSNRREGLYLPHYAWFRWTGAGKRGLECELEASLAFRQPSSKLYCNGRLSCRLLRLVALGTSWDFNETQVSCKSSPLHYLGGAGHIWGFSKAQVSCKWSPLHYQDRAGQIWSLGKASSQLRIKKIK